MSKKGKITVFVADYNNVVHYAPLLGIELLEKSQIGQEINIGIKYKDLSHVYKLGQCSKVPLVQVVPQPKPQIDGGDKKPVKKK